MGNAANRIDVVEEDAARDLVNGLMREKGLRCVSRRK